MREWLGQIAEDARHNNPIVGDRTASEFRSIVDLPGYLDRLPPDRKWKLLYDLGERELRLGNEADAIQRLTASLDAADSTSAPARYRKLSHFRLGIAYLRFAETQNCCQRNTPDSCIVPIQGEGIHQRKEGSQKAMQHLIAALRSAADANSDEDRLSVDETAKWLLNVAAMTLGTYPDAVPEEFRIPEQFFRSRVDFPRFRNVYPDLGLTTFNLCGGVVVDDLDGDLDLDIITCTWDPGGPTQVFRNNADGSFTEVTEGSGLKGFYGGLNMNQADFDNDGDLDIFIMRGAWLRKYGLHPNSLLRNDGDLKFTDVTMELGLAEPAYPTKTAAWADFDNDGDLDLYVGNESVSLDLYMGSQATEELNAPCQLFRNDGEAGFVDIAPQAGVADREFSMGAVWGDFNNDRYPDLYVSFIGNNRLYRNNKDGTFTDVAEQAGVLGQPSSFATWFFDYDNDGLLDIFVGCNSGPVGVLNSGIRFQLMKLYRNRGDETFEDVAPKLGLTYPAEPMGSNYGDLNNDGFADFYLATGNTPYSEITPNVMFLNQRAELFENVTMAGGFGHLQKGHGVSFADIDNDFDNDVYVQLGGAYPGDRYTDALFQNPGCGNNSITLILTGRDSCRCAIGARISLTVSDADGERRICTHVSSGSSFGANPLRQCIGIGAADHVKSVEVYWPASDRRSVFQNLKANTAYRIVEGVERAEEVRLPQFDFPARK
ncbi:MAG: CRTAC1 family protein [Planctomycetaceae bacterium]|nr:CRTAC1 family protein [Planctomycetaceae bacterium]